MKSPVAGDHYTVGSIGSVTEGDVLSETIAVAVADKETVLEWLLVYWPGFTVGVGWGQVEVAIGGTQVFKMYEWHTNARLYRFPGGLRAGKNKAIVITAAQDGIGEISVFYRTSQQTPLDGA